MGGPLSCADRVARILAVLVPLSVALGTAVSANRLVAEVRHKESVRFERRVDRAAVQVDERLRGYRDVLWSGRGLFRASRSVDRAEWQAYVDALQLGERHPGLTGVGYIAAIPHPELESQLESIRADDAPDFAIHPDGMRPEYLVVRYIEPATANLGSLGFDLAADPATGRAAVEASELGEDRLIGLREPGGQPGFWLLVPVYANGLPTLTVAERRTAHRGWVYALFSGAQVLAPIADALDQQVAITASDGGEIFAGLSSAAADPLRVERTLDFAGSRLRLSFASTDAFESAESADASIEPWAILVSGLMFGGLVAAPFAPWMGAYPESHTPYSSVQISPLAIGPSRPPGIHGSWLTSYGVPQSAKSGLPGFSESTTKRHTPSFPTAML
ncbi:MAG: hypothetical protein EXR69_16490 [Myxococcales bacterium]|nr:hypothetical protein [Myxococcales bacterium]